MDCWYGRIFDCNVYFIRWQEANDKIYRVRVNWLRIEWMETNQFVFEIGVVPGKGQRQRRSSSKLNLDICAGNQPWSVRPLFCGNVSSAGERKLQQLWSESLVTVIGLVYKVLHSCSNWAKILPMIERIRSDLSSLQSKGTLRILSALSNWFVILFLLTPWWPGTYKKDTLRVSLPS